MAGKKKEKESSAASRTAPGQGPSRREWLLLAAVVLLLVALLSVAPAALEKGDGYVRGYNRAVEECNRLHGASLGPYIADENLTAWRMTCTAAGCTDIWQVNP